MAKQINWYDGEGIAHTFEELTLNITALPKSKANFFFAKNHPKVVYRGCENGIIFIERKN